MRALFDEFAVFQAAIFKVLSFGLKKSSSRKHLQDEIGMLRQMAEAMSNEDDGLATTVCAQPGELLILSLRVQSGCRLISDEETDASAHEAQEGA